MEISDPAAANAAVYESEAAAAEYAQVEGLREVETRIVATYLDSDEPIFDLGCGAGRTTRALESRGFRVIGLDLSGALLRQGRTRSADLPLVQGNFVALPFRSNSVAQAFVSFNGLDYVYPRAAYAAALREVYRVLKPNGVFVYSGHNIVGRFGRHNQSIKWAVAAIARQHPSFLRLQRKGAAIRQWYWRYEEPFGEVVTFSAPPPVHARLQRAAGFTPVAVVGEPRRRSGMFVTLTSHHVHYVAKK